MRSSLGSNSKSTGTRSEHQPVHSVREGPVPFEGISVLQPYPTERISSYMITGNFFFLAKVRGSLFSWTLALHALPLYSGRNLFVSPFSCTYKTPIAPNSDN
ncbi:hypothetical protein M404DRAFT_335285 [Pisolithus tinctorius Marx 270]|uniref:Uncharacterized protein n=1 Tax=Pisolithus tinctorius Marx 270 TaxID=870435 RepID=A0A0C3JB67_PISTI|nr:hypothetical protein M404DRAFT_335285 [Pisolithus tinctorius Marx 270]